MARKMIIRNNEFPGRILRLKTLQLEKDFSEGEGGINIIFLTNAIFAKHRTGKVRECGIPA